MHHDDYRRERVKLQMFQAKLQFFQVLIQAVTLISTLILLAKKL